MRRTVSSIGTVARQFLGSWSGRGIVFVIVLLVGGLVYGEWYRREGARVAEPLRTASGTSEGEVPESKNAEVRRAEELRGKDRADAESVAVMLLEQWQRGRRGTEFWAVDVLPVELYAVRGYTRLGCTGGANTVWCRFRIESSTKGGLPIIKVWRIELEDALSGPGNTWQVRGVTEGQ